MKMTLGVEEPLGTTSMVENIMKAAQKTRKIVQNVPLRRVSSNKDVPAVAKQQVEYQISNDDIK